MYESFYQLTTNPFRLAPDPNFCFTHSGYKRAREYLEYALAQGEGFVMVTGRPGTGKTMLAETFIHGVDISSVTARRITASNYSADDLVRAVAYAYGLDAVGVDKATLRFQIQQYFLQQEQSGKRVLLIIDEAQALEHKALEELRILADLQTESRLMLQLFLIGQESLQELMRTPEMEQFQQRVIANYHLVPLNLLDARAYIEFRLLQAGWRGDPSFSSTAVLAIYRLSKGVPRHINKICNRLLLLGYGNGSHAIEENDVLAISMEMRDELLVPIGSEILHPYADSIASIPEIRSGLLTLDDLAIDADNLSQTVTAISEASKLARKSKEAFLHRHQNDPQVWDVQQVDAGQVAALSVAGDARKLVLDPPAIVHQQAVMNSSSISLGRFRWREALVTTAAMFAITTISIAALPTILGEKRGQEILTQNEIPVVPSATLVRNSPAAAAAKAASNETGVIPSDIKQDSVGQKTIELTAAEAVDVTDADPFIDDAPVFVQENDRSDRRAVAEDIYVERSQHAQIAINKSRESIFPVDSRELRTKEPQTVDENLVDITTAVVPADEDTAQLSAINNEQSLVVASISDDHQISETVIPSIDAQPAVAIVASHKQGASRKQVDTHPVQAVAQAGSADEIFQESSVIAYAGIISELLELGKQSINEYRLLTPTDNNAYGYYRAVLMVDPENTQAHDGVQAVIDTYVDLIHDAVNRDRIDKARLYVARGLSIQPGNKRLLTISDTISDLELQSASTLVADNVDIDEQLRMEEASQGANIFSIFSSFFKKDIAEEQRDDELKPVDWGDG